MGPHDAQVRSREAQSGCGTRASPPSRRRALLALHGAVALFGFSGLLGKVVVAPPLVVTCVRSLVAAATLGLCLLLQRFGSRHARSPSMPAPPGRDSSPLAWLVSGGLLLAAHWWAFFLAIQLGSVALGLLTFASYPLFATLLEPLVFRERLRLEDVLGCAAVLGGLGLVVPDYDLGSQAGRAAAWGVSSGFSFALLSLVNRRLTRSVSPLVIVTAQTGVAGVVLLPLALGAVSAVPRADWLRLIALGVVFTGVAHWAFTASLRRVPVRLAGVTAALEPVYGIGFAWLWLAERPDARMLAGGMLIVATTLLVTWRKGRSVQADG